MSYLVQDSKRGKVFATLKEAAAYAAEIRKATGEIIAVVETRRKVTHFYNFSK